MNEILPETVQALDDGPGFAPLACKHDLDAFRAELRRWLAAKVPSDWRERAATHDPAEQLAFHRWWFEELRAVGLTNPHWPTAWGGADISIAHRAVIFEEMAKADAPGPDLYVISLYHLPATLFAHGTPEQRDRFLSGVVERGAIWAQGFSEPGAGSDLAALRTRAERQTIDGKDVFVVNGQKIWSSFGMHADWYLLLARTDPDAPKKQQGISYFIMDLKSPGVTVRPIRQLTGAAEFAEVFLDNVVIPAENLIGEENQGWAIAQSTLAAERGLIIFEAAERMAAAFDRELEKGRETWLTDVGLRREYALLYARIRAARVLTGRMLEEIAADPQHGGGETATYIKLHYAVLLQDYSAFLARAEGLSGQVLEVPVQGAGHFSGRRMIDYLHSFSWTISGGSNEIMRNVVSERLLGLPRG